MPSRQFASLQELSLQRLKSRIPSDCPLVVRRVDAGGFVAATIDGRDELHGRFQVVHAFLDGYVACWRRVRPTVDAVSRTTVPRTEPPPHGPVSEHLMRHYYGAKK